MPSHAVRSMHSPVPTLTSFSENKFWGGTPLSWSDPGLCYNANYLLAMKTAVDGNPDIVRRLLAALLRAEKFYIENPAEATEAVIKATNTTRVDLEPILKDSQFSVRLSQSALITLGDHARWMIETIRHPGPRFQTI